MRSRARTAYTLTITSYLFILIGWIIPFWFGRFYESSRSKKQWGLFYVIYCEIGRCRNFGSILHSDDVDFGGANSPIMLESISILATIALALCSLALVVVLMFHCHVCGRKYSYHNYVTAAAIVQFTAAAFAFLTIILSAIANGVFFSNLPMDDIIEFPWSLLCFCIGEIMLIASAVIYLLITFRWKRYRHIYANKRYFFHNVPDQYDHLYRNSEPLPDYNIDSRYRFKPYNRNSFIGYYRGSRDDTSSLNRSIQSGHYFPHRSPWERSRYYYSYPHRIARTNPVYSSKENMKPFSTINSEFRRIKHGYENSAVEGKTHTWYPLDSWNRSLETKTIADVHM